MGIYQWTGGDDNGAFGDAENWIDVTTGLPGTAPGAGDTAIVNGSGVPLNGSGTVAALVLSGNGGTLTTSGLSVTAGTVVLGGSVSVVALSALVAAQEMEVSGGTATVSGGNDLTVDETQNSAATASTVGLDVGVTSGDTAALNLTGFGTQVFVQAGNTVLGDSGTGSMIISAGAQFTTTDFSDAGSGELTLGSAVGAQGTLVVTGLYSSLLVGGEVDVGEQGIGRLTIEAGAEAAINLEQNQKLPCLSAIRAAATASWW